MKGRAQYHFQAMAKDVGIKWGLSPITKIRLYSQNFLAKISHAAPVWARKNLCILHTSQQINRTRVGCADIELQLRCWIFSRDTPTRSQLRDPGSMVLRKSYAIQRMFEKLCS